MLPLRYRGAWRMASVFLLLLVMVATLMPAVWVWPDTDRLVSWFDNVDKWLHGITFAFLALWFAGQYRTGSYWKIALGLLVFGALIEGCQRLVTYRSSEWFDIVADAAGILTGFLIALAGLGGWSQRFENRYLQRKPSPDFD